MHTLAARLNRRIAELEETVDKLTTVNTELTQSMILIKQRVNRYPDLVVNKIIVDSLEAIDDYE